MCEVDRLKNLLHKKFEMKDLGATKKILGKKIRRDREARKLWLSQKNYIKKVLEKFSMLDTKPVSTPLANHFRLFGSQCLKNEKKIENMSKVLYAMYAMVCTRPDLTHTVSTVSRYLANPAREHWNAVKWIFKHLKGIVKHEILFRVNYSKPTCGLAHFNITYPWFKTCHFTYLKFKTLTAVIHLAHFRKKKKNKYRHKT